MKYIVFLSILLLFGFGCTTASQMEPTVTDFTTCVRAGNSILKSNPPQCEHNGEIFTLQLDDPTVTSTSDTATATHTNITDDDLTVTNFDDCVAVGNPIMESIPRQCRHNDILYTEPVGRTSPIEPTPPQTTSGMTLRGESTDDGIIISWQLYQPKAPQGYKVVYGITPYPTFEEHASVYVEKQYTKIVTIPLTDGETYTFRVCTYTGDGCINYSKPVSVTAPSDESSLGNKAVLFEAHPEGNDSYPTVESITLSANTNNWISWQTNGDATMGFKIAYSKNPHPVYPKRDELDNWIYVGDTAASSWELPAEQGPGTYYVRVCEYIGNACGVYSNEITVSLQ